MGNSYSNAEWCPNKDVIQVLSEGRGLQGVLLREDLRQMCIDVNVGSDHESNSWREHHKVVFDTEKPNDYYLLVLFPCHPDPRKQLLYTYNYRTVNKLNREINQRLKDSLQVSFDYQVSRMVIVCGSVVYKLNNLIGTGYIVWASYVNTTNHNHVVNQIQEHIPLFVHMDGYNQFESVVRLLPAALSAEPLNVASTKFFIPFSEFLWTNEADPRTQRAAPVDIATYEQVVDQCSDEIDEDDSKNTIGSLQQEPLPFSASEAESSNSGTPRTHNFNDLVTDDEIDALNNLENTLQIGASTPRIDELPQFVGIDEKSPDEVIAL